MLLLLQTRPSRWNLNGWSRRQSRIHAKAQTPPRSPRKENNPIIPDPENTRPNNQSRKRTRNPRFWPICILLLRTTDRKTML